MTRWISLWAVDPKPRVGYKIEYLYSDYDGSAIKFRYVKDDE